MTNCWLLTLKFRYSYHISLICTSLLKRKTTKACFYMCGFLQTLYVHHKAFILQKRTEAELKRMTDTLSHTCSTPSFHTFASTTWKSIQCNKQQSSKEDKAPEQDWVLGSNAQNAPVCICLVSKEKSTSISTTPEKVLILMILLVSSLKWNNSYCSRQQKDEKALQKEI